MLRFLKIQMTDKYRLVFRTSLPILPRRGLGELLTLVLIGIFALGKPSPSFWVLASAGLFLWILWAFRQPVHAFSALLFVWITVYSRSTIPFFEVAGGGNRGGVALGDLMWLGFVGAVLLETSLRGIHFPTTRPVSIYTLLMVPYVLLAFTLPLFGVFFGDWPLSYGLPGIRQIEWTSFAVLAYCLARQFSTGAVIYSLLPSVVLAAVLHAIYSVLQLLAAKGLIPYVYLFLDKIFSERFVKTWFFYPRTTGLLVNPNSYGLFGALVLVILVAVILSELRLGKQYKILVLICSLWAVFTSGSRSAILGVLVAFVILLISLIIAKVLKREEKLVGRALRLGFFVILVLAPIVFTVSIFLPEVLRKRLLLIKEILVRGPEADPNAIGRIESWSKAITKYWHDYPFGTWVPPGYAFSAAIDNYYVVVLTQGTPVYLIAYVLFLLGVILLGFYLLDQTPAESKWVGLTLLGFGGVITGASFTLSPLLEPQIIVLFWSMIGIAFAMVKK